MAMYYYASRLNEASCSGSRCSLRMPATPSEPSQGPSPAPEQAPIVADPALLRTGNGLSYYDNDDYYSMVRGNKFMSESACKHIVLNSGLNFVTSQKVESPQIQAVLSPRSLTSMPFMSTDRPEVEYRDGQVVTATVDGLIDLMRPGTNKSFKFTFLLCSRLYLKPHELLGKLCKKYFKNYDRLKERGAIDAELLHSEKEDMVGLVSILSEWSVMFPYDYRDDRMMALVRVISERCSADHMAEVRVDMSTTLEKLLDKLTALEQYEETLTEVPQISSVEHLASGDILTLGLTPIALATQLTLVELHRLSFVGPEEFVQAFAPHSTSPVPSTTPNASIKLHHVESKSTRNLEAYADWFNRLSYLVATDILKAVKTKYRARIIEQWVMTARECFNLGNFNSLMAIISALNMTPISRLKKTWSRTSAVCGQQLRQLELCIEPCGNHARYRAALAAAPSEMAVPLLSVTCRDLHFTNQSAPSKLAGNRVNFEKCCVLARSVDVQLAGRRLTAAEPPPAPGQPQHHAVWRFLSDVPTLNENATAYCPMSINLHLSTWNRLLLNLGAMSPPAPLPQQWEAVRRFLNDAVTLNENALELTSFEREPPVDNLEKERMKRLRGGS